MERPGNRHTVRRHGKPRGRACGGVLKGRKNSFIEIFSYTADNVKYITGEEPVNTVRVGASDARHYRISKDVPTVNCGLNPYNLGGPDEYIEIEELIDLAKIHTLTAFDYLSK